MFPHVVTVFNAYEDDELVTRYSVTILRGVLLDVSKGTNVAKTGLSDADAATLYIPFSVDARGADGVRKRYVDPKVFYAAGDTQNLWTLDSGGKSNSTSTYFVKGEVTEPMSLAELKRAYDFVFDVTTVDVRDFGDDMMHWQVGGK